MQNKKPFEIILHVGRVTSLQSWVPKNHVTVKPLMNVLPGDPKKEVLLFDQA